MGSGGGGALKCGRPVVLMEVTPKFLHPLKADVPLRLTEMFGTEVVAACGCSGSQRLPLVMESAGNEPSPTE